MSRSAVTFCKRGDGLFSNDGRMTKIQKRLTDFVTGRNDDELPGAEAKKGGNTVIKKRTPASKMCINIHSLSPGFGTLDRWGRGALLDMEYITYCLFDRFPFGTTR
jgi:hypothetical protein